MGCGRGCNQNEYGKFGKPFITYTRKMLLETQRLSLRRGLIVLYLKNCSDIDKIPKLKIVFIGTNLTVELLRGMDFCVFLSES